MANRDHLLMQMRANGINDPQVLDAMMQINRDVFLSPQFQNRSFEDTALPIAHGQTISQPSVVAMMTQLLMPLAGHKILEIGTGSGYQTIILSLLARRVYTIERIYDLLVAAKEKFELFKRTNITSQWGDGHEGWIQQAPFTRIMVTAAAAQLVPALCDQLAEGGRLVIPINYESNKDSERGQWLEIIEKQANGDIIKRRHWAVRFVPLLVGKTEQ